MLPSLTSPDAPWRSRFDRLDRRITATLAAAGIPILRISLGVVFLWFGALKLFPGLSPAQDLAARTIEQLTFGLVPPAVALPVLAAWEVLIGLGLLSGRFLRATLLLLALQMLGTLTPLVLFPAETFSLFPIAPTLEGQYILKNVVLIAAAMVVGATVRGGQLRAEPADLGEPVAAPAPTLPPSRARTTAVVS
ncbi:MAG TPA: DoxX family protein [Candidatus Limnocylindrales bacterium]|nr:DoxX family protein [Candidatus Limnocylindrales bacterium]